MGRAATPDQEGGDAVPCRRCDRATRRLKLPPGAVRPDSRQRTYGQSYWSTRGHVTPPRKTDLLQGTLDLIVLRLLRAGPANGWELTQSIQAVSRGALIVNYGTLYPALHRLEARGWVRAKWGTTENNRRARIYTLTASGTRQLELERESWRRFATALDFILGSA